MPSRNTIRRDADHAYYHVYSRGLNKDIVFSDSVDKDYFINLLARYLSTDPVLNKNGISYPNYHKQIELLCYCLMDNHFHLLIYQVEAGALTKFMKSLITSYTAYFNLRHHRSGPLFGGRFKASLISNDAYLAHISRYIHLNPRSWQRYPYSSFLAISTGKEPEWLKSQKILADYSSRQEYTEFIEDYQSRKAILDQIKHELANL